MIKALCLNPALSPTALRHRPMDPDTGSPPHSLLTCSCFLAFIHTAFHTRNDSVSTLSSTPPENSQPSPKAVSSLKTRQGRAHPLTQPLHHWPRSCHHTGPAATTVTVVLTQACFIVSSWGVQPYFSCNT